MRTRAKGFTAEDRQAIAYILGVMDMDEYEHRQGRDVQYNGEVANTRMDEIKEYLKERGLVKSLDPVTVHSFNFILTPEEVLAAMNRGLRIRAQMYARQETGIFGGTHTRLRTRP
jgi:hypothetical protein